MEGDLNKTRRRLPHWHLDGSTYFITFRVKAGELTMDERLIVLNHIRDGHVKFYELFAAVIMPNHGHALLKPLEGFDLSRIGKGIKGVSARMINKMRQTAGALWQDESFDRIIRNAGDFDEKLNYIINNAVKRELVIDPWVYPALLVMPSAG